MKPVTINSWPFIGFSAKTGEIEKGAILKEKEVIKQAKELLPLMIKEMEKRNL
jgi:hypothetical protein